MKEIHDSPIRSVLGDGWKQQRMRATDNRRTAFRRILESYRRLMLSPSSALLAGNRIFVPFWLIP